LPVDTSSDSKPGMAHVNPLFDFQLSHLINGKYDLLETKYNRMRIPLINHTLPASKRFFGEIKIIKLKKN
jgi:hypothetical protein